LHILEGGCGWESKYSFAKAIGREWETGVENGEVMADFLL